MHIKHGAYCMSCGDMATSLTLEATQGARNVPTRSWFDIYVEHRYCSLGRQLPTHPKHLYIRFTMLNLFLRARPTHTTTETKRYILVAVVLVIKMLTPTTGRRKKKKKKKQSVRRPSGRFSRYLHTSCLIRRPPPKAKHTQKEKKRPQV